MPIVYDTQNGRYAVDATNKILSPHFPGDKNHLDQYNPLDSKIFFLARKNVSDPSSEEFGRGVNLVVLEEGVEQIGGREYTVTRDLGRVAVKRNCPENVFRSRASRYNAAVVAYKKDKKDVYDNCSDEVTRFKAVESGLKSSLQGPNFNSMLAKKLYPRDVSAGNLIVCYTNCGPLVVNAEGQLYHPISIFQTTGRGEQFSYRIEDGVPNVGGNITLTIDMDAQKSLEGLRSINDMPFPPGLMALRLGSVKESVVREVLAGYDRQMGNHKSWEKYFSDQRKMEVRTAETKRDIALEALIIPMFEDFFK